MHRNTYINSPGRLDATYNLISRPNVYFAGQMTGVEGYIESAGSGFVAGLNAAKHLLGQERVEFPKTTMIGAMATYVSCGGNGAFVPMNANFGIIQPWHERVKGGKIAKYEKISARALEVIEDIARAL
jgi:methylenetetrahydrofolate--tRNA-(uracil-5-)-methyltransferase